MNKKTYIKSKNTILSFLVVGALLFQLLPSSVVQAQAVYDDHYDSGDFPIVDAAGSALYFFDASDDYSSSAGPSSTVPLFTLFGPNGQMYVINHDTGTSSSAIIKCYKPTNNYGSSGSVETCDGNNTSVNSNTLIDPDDGSTTSVSNVLNGQLPLDGAIAPNGDIWLSYSINMATGLVESPYIAQVTQASGFTTVNVYDTTFGGDLTDTYGNMGIDVDVNGNIWFSSHLDQGSSNYNNKVYCLDGSNSYQVCTGANFDSHGGLSTSDGPWDLKADANGDIFVATVQNELYRFDASDSYSSDFVDIDTLEPNTTAITYLDFDSNNNVWVTSGTITSTTQYVVCVENDNNFNSVCPGTSTLSFTKNSANDQGPMYIDSNDDIWVLKYDDTTTQIFCFDASNSYAACTGTNFTSGALSLSAETGNHSNQGDPFGADINRLMDIVAGQDQVNISATVDPVISFTLSTSTCALGTLSPTTVETCSYDVEVDTNAANGYTAYIEAVSDLIPVSGSDDIDASDGTVTATNEEYGVSTSAASQTITQTNTTCAGLDNGATAMNASSLTTSPQSIANATAPVDGDSTTVCHAAAISDTTAAGSYSHQVIITVVGSF